MGKVEFPFFQLCFSQLKPLSLCSLCCSLFSLSFSLFLLPRPPSPVHRMSLADELLADLEDLQDDDQQLHHHHHHQHLTGSSSGPGGKHALGEDLDDGGDAFGFPTPKRRRLDRDDDDQYDDDDQLLQQQPHEQDESMDDVDSEDGGGFRSSLTNGGTSTAHAHADAAKTMGHQLLQRSMQSLNVNAAARLWTSPRLQSVLAQIDRFLVQQPHSGPSGTTTAAAVDASSHQGSVENHPEYQTIVDANSVSVDIEHEILLAHKVRFL